MQVCGALIASGILKAMLPDEIRSSSSLGANSVPPEQTVGRAFLGALLTWSLAACL